MEKKYISPNNANKLEGLDFVYMQSPIEITNKLKIQKIVSKFYKYNL